MSETFRLTAIVLTFFGVVISATIAVMTAPAYREIGVVVKRPLPTRLDALRERAVLMARFRSLGLSGYE